MKKLLLLTVVCVLGLFGTLRAQENSFSFDFNDGTLTGWRVFKGSFQATADDWHITPAGDASIHGAEGTQGVCVCTYDGSTKLSYNYIVTENAYQITESSTLSWYVRHADPTYVASDPYKVVVSETGADDSFVAICDMMTFDLVNTNMSLQIPTEYAGKSLYIGFYTQGMNGGTLILDNIVLTPAGGEIPGGPVEVLPPLAPQNFAATVVDKTIVLTWDAVEGATGYNVYSFPDTLAKGLTEPTFTTGELEYGSYCFAVTAFNEAGEGARTADLCKTIESPVPQNLVAEAGESTITLTWDAVEDAAYYNVYQGEEKIAAELTEPTYTTDTLVPGDYCFTVTSFKDDEESEASEQACATIEEPVVEDANKITLGADSKETAVNLPSSLFYGNTLSQQIYTAEEMGGVNGDITKIAFMQKTTAEYNRNWTIYMVNTEKAYFESYLDFVEVSASDIVFDGTVTTTAEDEWLEIELQNSFYYEGKNILLCVNDHTNQYGNWFDFQSYSTDTLNRSMVNNRDSNPYDVNNMADAWLSPQTSVNTIQFTIDAKEGLSVYPEEVALGDIMLGDYWTDKAEASAKATVYASGLEVTEITCDNAFFTLEYSDLTVSPIELTIGYDKTASAGTYTGTVTVKAGGDEVQLPVSATVYSPVEPDLFELAKKVTFTENAFTDSPDFATLHDDYLLPNENKDNVAPDAVYAFTLENEKFVNVNIEGVNSLYAVYKAENLGESNGPQADNNFVSTDERITDTAFIYDFNDGSLADFTIIDNDEYKDHTWKIEDGALISYSFDYWWDENDQYNYMNRADERIVTNTAYPIVSNSVLSFEAAKGVDESQAHSGEAVIVEVTKDGETFTEVYSAVFSDYIVDWRTVRVDIGAIFVNKGLEFGDYKISIRHNIQGLGFVRVDYLALTERSIVYPAGDYYLVAAAKEAFKVNVNLEDVPVLPTAPAAPVVTAEAISHSEIKLTWEAVDGATSYNVYQGAMIVAEDLTETTYTVKNLKAETNYCFTVTAVNEVGESEESMIACATTLKEEGIAENEASFNVYPNPVKDMLFIETEAAVEEVSVYDVYGRLQVTETPSHQGEVAVDMTDLNSGIYFVKVRTEKGESVRRILKF